MIIENPFHPNTRKHAIYAAFHEGGAEAAVALNATMSNPVKDTTLRTWFSTWRNAPATPVARPPKLTADLRAAAIAQIEATRLAVRAELYRLPDGRTARLRTNAKRCLINNTDNVFAHGGDVLVFVAPKEVETLVAGYEVYVVPLAVARAAFDKARADWMSTNPNTSGNNNIDTLYLDCFPNATPRNSLMDSQHDYATKWAQYRLPAGVMPPVAESEAHEVEYRGVRIVCDQQILSAPTVEGLVTVLNLTTRFREGPPPSDANYMREVAERMRVFSNAKVRSDTARHFIDDMDAAGAVIWIKREIELR